LFTYPSLKKSSEGKLRLLFELQPMAFIMEQAGGMATDGNEDILSIQVGRIDQLSPIYIGSAYEVQLAKKMLSS